MESERIPNRERIRLTLETGLRGTPQAADLDRYQRGVDAIIRMFEDASKLSIDDEGVGVDQISLDVATPDHPDGSVNVVYKKHTGWFPFPHDHCTVTVCFKWVIDGKVETVCLEIEYPCDVDWPLISAFG